MELLHSQIVGEGPPLLVIHGYMGMSDNWKTLGLKFADFHQVHLIDQRNHGRSFHDDAFDYDLLVEDLYRYLAFHNLDNVNLLGHSMGGKVAMFFAVTFPELVSKLVVADIAPRYYEPHHQDILAALNAINFDLHNTRQKVEEILALYIKRPEVLQFLLKNVYRKNNKVLDFRFNRESLTLNNIEVGEALPTYTSYNGPTLFLRGEQSDYITENDQASIKEHFPNSQLITVKNAGHWLHSDNPEHFFDEVVRFLK
jgi:pimeloyl-ACP methyl ester carboxylesterase